MVINFLQEKKRQRNLILILALIIIAILIIVWQGFLRGGETPTTPSILPSLPLQKITIDWQILQDPQIVELQAFEPILPFGDEIGRENPFIPY